MSEEYLLAWSEHHATFFSAMSELISGDVLTDVSVWAGQTMYSAHRLVLALSSSYFRFAVTGAAQEGRYPVIFLKDVSSRDFERLLAYMYHGEVSVPQSELLSLIAAAKSLGVRGLAEDGVNLNSREDERERESGEEGRGVKREAEKELPWGGVKREGEREQSAPREPPALVKKPKLSTSPNSQPPRLQHKAASQKLWTKRSSSTGGKEEKSWSSNTRKEEKEEETTQAPLKLQKENVVQKTSSAESEEEEVTKTSELKAKKEGAKALTTKGKEKVSGGEKVGEKQETETTTGQQQQQGVSPKLFAPFFEVSVKQEEEDDDESSSDPAEPDYLSPAGLSLVRRSLIPPSLLPPSVRLLAPPPQQQAAIQRNTGTCHFCGRSFMKNKQLMNHVCPMRPSGK